MASVGFGLLKSILSGDTSISALHENGIDDSYFQNREREAFIFIRDYFLRYGSLPQIDTVRAEIQDANCFAGLPEEISSYWVDKVRERRRHKIAASSILEIEEHLRAGNVQAAVEHFGVTYSQLQRTYSELAAIPIREAERQVIEEHNRIQRATSIPGIPFGFPYLDAISGGTQPGDSNIIVGMTSAGKTRLALKASVSGWYSGANILVLCTEMPVKQVARVVLAIEGGFDTNYLKLGRMSGFGIEKAMEIVNSDLTVDGERRGNWYRFLPGGMFANLEDVLFVAKDMRPDLLILDGAGYIKVKNKRPDRWERMIEVMEAVKEFAMTNLISTLSTYHFNKTNPGTAEGIYGGLAMAQIASMIMAFEYERKEDRTSSSPVQYRLLKLLKGRDGERGTIRCLYDMTKTQITQDRVVEGYTAFGDGEEEVIYADNEPTAII